MLFYKKVLILFIIILFSYILYRIYKKHSELIKHEGFSFIKTIEQEINDATNIGIPIQLNSINNAYTQLPISQYLIKGSFNSGK